jgi:hypothetical protein
MCANSTIIIRSAELISSNCQPKIRIFVAIEMRIADFRGFPQECFCGFFRETALFKDQHSLIAFLKLKSIVQRSMFLPDHKAIRQGFSL